MSRNVLFVGALVALALCVVHPFDRPVHPAVVGDSNVLLAHYERWKEQDKARPRRLVIALAAAETRKPRGQALFDLTRERLEVRWSDAVAEDALDVWVADTSVVWPAWSATQSDGLQRLGTLTAADDGSSSALDVPLDLETFSQTASVIVTEGGRLPQVAAVALGHVSLFERLLAVEASAARGATVETAGLFKVARPAPTPTVAVAALVTELVAAGEELFFEETFGGNGRTCGTCHPAENNFTLDPAFIATRSPFDPLFVAEFNPALNFELNGGLRFENPVLMRQLGLILVNPTNDVNDFVMRSVPHLSALAFTTTPQPGEVPPGTSEPLPVPPVHRLGWGGNGSPFDEQLGSVLTDGSLRHFALGAVRQHFTKTMARSAPADFRWPTGAELDALEAFQLSIGRRDEFSINSLNLTDQDAQDGISDFRTAARCTFCHGNAGANKTVFNFNTDTGVEDFLVSHPDGTGEPRPFDRGFGHRLAGVGENTFSVQSLIEAADTLPSFHNNTALTLEDAVNFYVSDEFNASPSAPLVNDFTPASALRMVKFLRAINSLDNIDSATRYVERAIDLIENGPNVWLSNGPSQAVERACRLAQADIKDVMGVLDESTMNQTADPYLEDASSTLDAALGNISTSQRLQLLDLALAHLEDGRTEIGTGGF